MSQPATAKRILPAMIVCSFCDNDETTVATMIQGKPGIAICDDCVAICVHSIIDDTRRKRGLPVSEGKR